MSSPWISDREIIEKSLRKLLFTILVGLESYNNQAPFDASTYFHFRERIGADAHKSN